MLALTTTACKYRVPLRHVPIPSPVQTPVHETGLTPVKSERIGLSRPGVAYCCLLLLYKILKEYFIAFL
jgi:hypothetical protein